MAQPSSLHIQPAAPLSPTPTIADNVADSPFETEDLRKSLARFLNSSHPAIGEEKVGDYRWGVYAFFDYDGEPIYVGQTNEKLRTRIRRHLTNQRTDAVAMSVLDPFEVHEIAVWPLPQFQNTPGSDADARSHLNALEKLVYDDAVEKSQFKAILNEKNPPSSPLKIALPESFRQCVVSEKVHELRAHPDFRLARRSLIISRLAQVISERKVQGGLRRVLLIQAKRIEWLARRRYQGIGGDSAVDREDAGGASD